MGKTQPQPQQPQQQPQIQQQQAAAVQGVGTSAERVLSSKCMLVFGRNVCLCEFINWVYDETKGNNPLYRCYSSGAPAVQPQMQQMVQQPQQQQAAAPQMAQAQPQTQQQAQPGVQRQ